MKLVIAKGICSLSLERDMQLVIAKGICSLSLQKEYVACHCKRDM